jgi:hypothetical protein
VLVRTLIYILSLGYTVTTRVSASKPLSNAFPAGLVSMGSELVGERSALSSVSNVSRVLACLSSNDAVRRRQRPVTGGCHSPAYFTFRLGLQRR